MLDFRARSRRIVRVTVRTFQNQRSRRAKLPAVIFEVRLVVRMADENASDRARTKDAQPTATVCGRIHGTPAP
jgi:hypothetical protein